MKLVKGTAVANRVVPFGRAPAGMSISTTPPRSTKMEEVPLAVITAVAKLLGLTEGVTEDEELAVRVRPVETVTV